VAVGLRPFSPLEHDGTFARILAVLRLQLDELGRIDWDTWCVDGSNIRAGRAAAGAKKGAPKSRWPLPRRLGLEIHLLTDGNGLPLEVLVSAGQRHESCFFEPLLERLLAEGRTPIHLLGDKGYSAPRIRRWLSERSITPVIPHRADEHKLHPELPPLDFPRYRRRNVVERTIGFLKQCRSVATRFDKLPKCFLAMIKLAFIRLYLRKIDSSDTT